MEIVLFCFAVIGLSHIIVDGKIFQPIRNIFDKYLPSFVADVVHCYVCSGTWAGFFCGFFVFSGWQILLAGFAGSFLSQFAAIFFNFLEARTIVSLDDKR